MSLTWAKQTGHLADDHNPNEVIHTITTNSTKRPTTTLGIDFETFYGKHYSLRKLTTTVYVRGLRFEEIHGASVSVNGGDSRWFRPTKLAKYLATFDWQDTAVLAHNCAFDGFILFHHFGITPAYYYDTMSMARGAHSHDISASLNEVAKFYGLEGKLEGALEKTEGKRWHELTDDERGHLIEYCNRDVDVMWEIFILMLDCYPDNELDLVDLSVRAFARPLLHVDAELVEQEQIREFQETQALLNRVAERVGADPTEIELRLASNPQFAQMLQMFHVEPPVKISPRTGEETYAFAKNDLGFQALHTHPNEQVRELIDARLSVKSTIGASRAARVNEHSGFGAFPIPIMLNYCKAHTMRWTGGDKINPQNFPSARTSSKLRHTLVAPKGFAVVVIDSSQIEDRMNAYVSGQRDVLDAYAAGQDNYKLMASRIYNTTIDNVDKKQRFVGKVARLGLGYQCGVDKFTDMLRSGAMGPPLRESDLSDEDVKKAHATYRQSSGHIVNFWATMSDVIGYMRFGKQVYIRCKTTGEPIASTDKGRILMPNGLLLHYPSIMTRFTDEIDEFTGEKKRETVYRSGKHSWSKLYGGKLTENFIQSLARIVVGEQMLLIARQFPVVMMTHDEVVYLAPEQNAQEAYEFGLEAMRFVPSWCEGLPVDAEGGYGHSYGEVK